MKTIVIYFSSEMEDFPALKDIWKYYEDDSIDYGTKATATQDYSYTPLDALRDMDEVQNSSQTLPNMIGLNNDSKRVIGPSAYAREKVETLPGQSNQINREGETNFFAPQQAFNFDPNCTEQVWNVTLVPSSLRKNTLYLTVSI